MVSPILFKGNKMFVGKFKVSFKNLTMLRNVYRDTTDGRLYIKLAGDAKAYIERHWEARGVSVC